MSDRKRSVTGSGEVTAPALFVLSPDDTTQRPSGHLTPAPLPPVAEKDTAEAIDKAAAEIWIGQVIAGKYRVDKVIGRGGMGVVLRATHRSLHEPVAIKVLRPSLMAMDGMVTRFTREARAASKIKSDHVVRVTDVDALESGVPYMVMEYLDGIDLAEVLREQGRLSIELAVRYVIEACDAIAEAHAKGVIHRDLKPGNLFLARRRDGTELIKVLDFGISKLEDPEEQQDATRTGTMMGSPKFMSPEQMLSMHDVDGRADIWALGTILYALLTGVTPFMAESTPQICALVLTADPVPPRAHRPELPEELEQIVLRCLQRNPAQRFSTATELCRALAPFAPSALAAKAAAEVFKEQPPEKARESRAIPAPPASSRTNTHATAMVSSVDTEELLMPRRRSPGVILGGLALALAVGLGLLMLAEQREPGPVDVASTTALPALGATAAPPAAPPSSAAPPTVTPAASESAEAATAPTPSGPASSGFRPGGGKRPSAPPGSAKRPTGTSDPFGGSRN